MKTCIAILFLSMINLAVFGQAVKIKKGIASVDNVPYASIDEKSPIEFNIKALETDSELVFVQMFDPTPDGGLEGFDDRYFVLTFPDYDGEAEVKTSSRTELIKILYQYKMIVDNWIPEESFKVFFARYGRKEKK